MSEKYGYPFQESSSNIANITIIILATTAAFVKGTLEADEHINSTVKTPLGTTNAVNAEDVLNRRIT